VFKSYDFSNKGALYSRCKTGFSDLQNVATNYCVIQRLPKIFAKTNFTVPLTHENPKHSYLVSRPRKHDLGLLHLKIEFVLLLLLDNGRFLSGPPIQAQVPHADAKPPKEIS
jgi:hypothetical protein